MQRIRIDQAAAGMVLARKVENAKGMILCGDGTVLTDTLLERLERSGVSHLTVEGRPVAEQEGPSLREELEALDARFAGTVGEPLMEAIREMVAARIRERHGLEEGTEAEGDVAQE